jgi:hypothetical protein
VDDEHPLRTLFLSQRCYKTNWCAFDKKPKTYIPLPSPGPSLSLSLFYTPTTRTRHPSRSLLLHFQHLLRHVVCPLVAVVVLDVDLAAEKADDNARKEGVLGGQRIEMREPN